MRRTLANLKRGERGIIKEFSEDNIPLKLLEMGCLPGNEVEMLQLAPFKDPMYLNVNGSYLAFRREVALLIEIDLIS